ncbi:MAG TPA: 1-deoxy-D-xylulose-5-phosphate reductoisomerase [Vicinamibacterales bacterium]|jgi:1-deoxy-D-xylulose-5-phosphate reductoisomerase
MPTFPRKRIAILGSTGSIGQSALSVVEQQAGRLEIVGLAAGANVERFAEQVRRFRPRAVAMATGEAIDRLRALAPDGLPRQVGVGRDGLAEVATHPDVDIVLCASAGTDGLEAVLAAIEAGKTIALANKEVLVMAGAVVMEAARRRGVAVLPVDSEHNAVHQCLHERQPDEVRRLILTASGGPFRGWTADDLRLVGPEQALKHPTWRMGRKITIDSATLMNKGLEIIEARWLFDMPVNRIDVVVHPQSVVHSMVEFVDGSIVAQLGVTDMRLPIQYAFSYPRRWSAPVPSLDLVNCGRLEFAAPDVDCFPCLSLARQALAGQPSLPVVLNAANEIAVAAFLDGQIGFMSIPELVGEAMRSHEPLAVRSLAEVRAVDDWARAYARELLPQLSVKP